MLFGTCVYKAFGYACVVYVIVCICCMRYAGRNSEHAMKSDCHLAWILSGKSSLRTLCHSVPVIAGARKAQSLLQARPCCNEAPRLRGISACIAATLDLLPMSASTHSKVAPRELLERQQCLHLCLLPVAALIGPFDDDMATPLDKSIDDLEQVYEESMP